MSEVKFLHQAIVRRLGKRLLDGFEENSVELVDVLLLLAFILLPAEGFGQVFGAPRAHVRGLKHYKQPLDLEQHLAFLAFNKLGLIADVTLAQRQAVDGLPELGTQVKSLKERVQIASGASTLLPFD